MTVTHTITLPDIGDYKDVPVIDLLVKPGDAIDVDTPLLIIESDKATIEVPSPMSGKVVELIVAVGAKVSHGTPLIVVEAESAAFAGSLKAPPTPPTAAQLTRTPAPPSVTPSPAFPRRGNLWAAMRHLRRASMRASLASISHLSSRPGPRTAF